MNEWIHSFIFSKDGCKGGIFLNWSTGKDIEVKGQFVHVYSFCYIRHEVRTHSFVFKIFYANSTSMQFIPAKNCSYLFWFENGCSMHSDRDIIYIFKYILYSTLQQ